MNPRRHAALARALCTALALWLPLAVSACSDTAPGIAGAELCNDGVDNDGDSYIDCADQDCWSAFVCSDASSDVSGDSGDSGDAVTSPDEEVQPSSDAPVSGDDGARDGSDAPDVTFDPDAPPPGTCDPCGNGELIGKVCAPNEQVFVSGATITIIAVGCDGIQRTYQVESDATGTYHFDDLPCGTHTVYVEKGSFSREYNVQVQPDQVNDITGTAHKLCFQATSANIAVLQGNWDNMEGLLDQLGLAYDRYTVDDIGEAGTIVDFLSNPTKLAQYEVIFANCGGFTGWLPQDHPAVMQPVKDWVLAGGSLYMSDYAWVLGEWAFPDAIEFFGDDAVSKMYTDQSPQLITGGTTVQGQVVDGTMAAYLGKTSLAITFDQGPQIAPQATGPAAFGHVVAEFNQFLSDPPVTGTIPLVVSYVPGPDAGRVVYTNFHNDAQTSADMLKILEYLVFTL